jgi:20S proteasome alpha/beta subunit
MPCCRFPQAKPRSIPPLWEDDLDFPVSSSLDGGGPVTLVVALAGKNEIVIGADRLCLMGDQEGQYSVDFKKLKTVNRSWVMGFAGSRAGYSIFERSEREKWDISGSFYEQATKFSKKLECVYLNSYSAEISFLFCGIEKTEPLIYTWSSRGDQVHGMIPATEGRSAIGFPRHGAMYFIHTHHTREMDVNQLIRLCYFSLSQAVSHDRRLNGPVDIAIIRPDGVVDLNEEQCSVVGASCQQVQANIRDLLTTNAPVILK